MIHSFDYGLGHYSVKELRKNILYAKAFVKYLINENVIYVLYQVNGVTH